MGAREAAVQRRYADGKLRQSDSFAYMRVAAPHKFGDPADQPRLLSGDGEAGGPH